MKRYPLGDRSAVAFASLGDRSTVVDIAITAAVAVAMSVPFFTSPPGHVTALGWIFTIGAVVPLLWRRRWPFAVGLLVVVFATLVSLHHRPGQMLQYSGLVAIYTVADLGTRWQRLVFLWGIILTFPPASLLVKRFQKKIAT